MSDALEDLGFITSECGQASELAGVLDAQQPDLVVLGVSVDGIEVGNILEMLVKKNYSGKVLVIGPHQVDFGKSRSTNWRGIRHCDASALCQRLSAPGPYAPASRCCFLPTPAPSPAVDVAEALKAGWLELWYQQKINVRTLVPSGAEALVRMRHPTWGVVPPAYFIRDDKDPHFRALSKFVVGRAIDDWRYLLEQQGPVDLSINLPVSFLGRSAGGA